MTPKVGVLEGRFVGTGSGPVVGTDEGTSEESSVIITPGCCRQESDSLAQARSVMQLVQEPW